MIADTLQLDEVEVVATRIDQPLKYQPTAVEVIDSTRLSLLHTQSIGETLSLQSSLFIKNNGPGGMATASQRGLSSEQIQVLWEGIPINSPTLGQADLSLLPTSFFSGVQVSSG
ncbi:TonB-dependent receptor, partial [Fodinibius sp.]|uniref:TonB-dependent receptor n=1 Tax=Fodinibius sp. TaxID=1872440 RepID=UPI00356A7625